MTQFSWGDTVGRNLAHAVRSQRLRRGFSAQALADRTAELGHPLPRSVIANLENGRKVNIAVPDLLILGRALGVPPMLLVFRVGLDDTVEAAPGEHHAPWAALKWASGEQPFPAGSAQDHDEWRDGATPLRLYREEDAAFVEWHNCRQRAAGFRDAAGKAETNAEKEGYLAAAQSNESLAAIYSMNIQRHRSDQEQAGLKLRPVPDELQRVWEEK